LTVAGRLSIPSLKPEPERLKSLGDETVKSGYSHGSRRWMGPAAAL
jgi:hypothetical protein